MDEYQGRLSDYGMQLMELGAAADAERYGYK